MYIHVYMNNPTKGGTDGTQISEGDGLNPLTVGPLLATNNQESDPIKIALRCEPGYVTTGPVTVKTVGPTAAKWAFALDSGNGTTPGTFGAYGDPLTINDPIGATNYVIWVKAKATSDEGPVNDVSVDIQVEGQIAAAN